MTPTDAPTTDVCQCTKANGAHKSEGKLGTMVICPDCHLEEVTFREPDNAEQAVFISERDVYIAFKGSPSLKETAEKHPSDQSIKKAIRKREKGRPVVNDLIRNYGISSVVATIRNLLDDRIFTCTNAARHRFPDLFPKEQVSNCEEGQDIATGQSSTKEIEPLDGGCDQSNEEASSFAGNHAFPDVCEPSMY